MVFIMSNEFPKNVFEDVEQGYFAKHNKKGVSEDFVTENLKIMGWNCYRVFDDTGVDIVARKDVCPKSHTKWNEKESKECHVCSNKLLTITRFIQVKTRRKDSTGNVGYTLDTADIRSDPRHIILVYSDSEPGDFLILPMFHYLKFFTDNEEAGAGHFGTPSFRYENNKVNQLKITITEEELRSFSWSYKDGSGTMKTVSWDSYLNENGMMKLSDPMIDIEFEEKKKETTKMKLDLIHSYRSGEEIQGTKDCVVKKKKSLLTIKDKKKIKMYESAVKNFLKQKTSKTPEEITKMREDNCKKLWKKVKNDSALVKSIQKSLIRFKEFDIEP